MVDHSAQPTIDIVVLDTCILISNVLRFIALSLATKGHFQPAWSPIIRDEWLRNASRLWGVSRSDLEIHWAQWERDFPLADQGTTPAWKEGLQYSDPKDWHVIATARAAQARFNHAATAILTVNSKDFNRSELARLGISRLQPDMFFCSFWGSAKQDLIAILEQMPSAITAPDKEPLTIQELLKRARLFNLSKNYSLFITDQI